MPPKSEAQRKLMHMAANNEGGAGGVPQAVGEEFAAADKGGSLPDRIKPSANDRRKKLYPSMKE